MTTFTIKTTNHPKVIEKILSLCRRKLYKIKSVNACTACADDLMTVSLTLADLKEGKEVIALNHIKKIIEVVEAQICNCEDAKTIVKNDFHVPENPVNMEGAKDVNIQILIGPNDGSKNIVLRKFRIMPGGHTPHHTHDFEHVIKAEKGIGVLVDADGKEYELHEGMSAFVPANVLHQFKNPYDEPFEFLCIVKNV